MALRIELSVVRAMAPSSGRSRSNRPTNSAEKCWASAADPPLPQASTLPPLVTHARTACTAAAIGLLKDWADWYLRAAHGTARRAFRRGWALRRFLHTIQGGFHAHHQRRDEPRREGHQPGRDDS